LSHIGDAVPARWVDIHKKIESATDNYMDLKEFRALCAKNEIKQNEDVDILSGYFHDIGVVLHFQDNPLLKKTVILKPTWATNAVYRIFDHDTILPKQGRFTKTDVFKIWCDQAYCDMQDELLEIMKKFRLVYQIKETENLVAPQLLPDNKPEYNLIAQRFIQFRFNYEAFMPKGILWQTIVALHHHIKNHDWVWKTGVILETENTQAEIIENNVLRLITIKIVGSNKTSLLSIIRETINNINNSYYKLKVEQLIPCNCTVCQNIEPPHFYKYSSLLNRKEKGKKTIECDVSFEDVNVQSLLDEVIKEKHDFEPEYNIKNIGTLLKESFNDVKFQEFCMFHFPEVQNGWGSEYDKTQKIMALLDYCKRHRRIDALLRLMENENPAQFDLHKPYR